MGYVTNQYGQKVWEEDYAQASDAGFSQLMSSNVALIQQADAQDAAEKAQEEAKKAAEAAKKRAAEIKAKQDEAAKEAERAAAEAQQKAAIEAQKAAQERLRQQQEQAAKAAEDAAQRAAEAAAKAAEEQADEAAKQAAAAAQKAAEDAAANAARLAQASAPDPDPIDTPRANTATGDIYRPPSPPGEQPFVEPRYQPPSALAPAGETQTPSPPTPPSPVDRVEATRSSDGQTLAQQTEWTRNAFRQRYGDRADVEWIREHERELERNRALYGAPEPQAGTAPVTGAPAGTPAAPNRVIGAVEPPKYSGASSLASDPLFSTTPPSSVTPPAGEGASAPTALPGQQPRTDAQGRPLPGPSTQITQPGTAPTALPPRGVLDPRDVQSNEPLAPSTTVGAAAPQQDPNKVWIRDTQSRNRQQVDRDKLPAWLGPGSPWVVEESPTAAPTKVVDPRDVQSNAPLAPSTTTAQTAPPVASTGSGRQILVKDPATKRVQAVDVSRWTEFQNKGWQWIGDSNPAEPTSPDEAIITTATVGNDQLENTITGADWPTAQAEGWQIVGRPSQPPSPYRVLPEGPQNPRPPGNPYQVLPEGPQNPRPEGSQYQPLSYTGPSQQRPAEVTPSTPSPAPPRDPNIRPSVPPPGPSTQITQPRDPSAPQYTAQPARSPQPVIATGARTDPVIQASMSPKPIASIVQLANQNKTVAPQDQQNMERNVLSAIGAMMRGDASGSWAEPYLNDVARLAWAREERNVGRFSDPRQTPVEYIEKWKDAWFGSDTNVPLVKELDQQMIDYAVARSGGPDAPFDWRNAYGPKGEKGLISRQISSIDCGPNAYSVILRSRGINLDPNQAFDYAKRNGFHNGNEFNGPGAMVSWINQSGLQASQHGIDPNVINAELDAGRPVLLSSRSHWYAITGRNERGQYYTGATGSVVGNPEWANLGDLVYAGARPDTMVLTRGKDVRSDAPIVQQYNLKPRTGDPGLNRAMLSQQTVRSAVPGTPGQPPAQTQPMANTESLNNLQAPPMFSQAKPRPGLVAGQAEPVDQMARVWQQAYTKTGDRGFADGLSALLIGEGGMRGGVGDSGQSFGPYQFYWGGGEGNGFEAWLRANKGFTGSRTQAQQMAKDVDLATEYYLPRVKSFYDAGTAKGHQNPVQAIAVGGHNRGAPNDPKVWRHYADAWENWKRGNPEQQNTVQTTSAKLLSNPSDAPPAELPMRPSSDSGGYTLPQITVNQPPLDIRGPDNQPYQQQDREGLDLSDTPLIGPPERFPVPHPATQTPLDELVRAPTEPRYAYQGHRNNGLLLRQSTGPSEAPLPGTGPSEGQQQMEAYLQNPENWTQNAIAWGDQPLPEIRTQEEQWNPPRQTLPTPQQPHLTPAEAQAVQDAWVRQTTGEISRGEFEGFIRELGLEVEQVRRMLGL